MTPSTYFWGEGVPRDQQQGGERCDASSLGTGSPYLDARGTGGAGGARHARGSAHALTALCGGVKVKVKVRVRVRGGPR